MRSEVDDKKKGVVQYFLDSEEEKMYLRDYVPTFDDFLDWEQTKESSWFAVKKYKDSLYRGEIDPETAKRSGRGVITYNSKRIYEGEWVADKRHGNGFERFANGNEYFGQYKEGKVHGQGKYRWNNGMEYEGQFRQGMKHGYGVWKGLQNEEYVGEWKNN